MKRIITALFVFAWCAACGTSSTTAARSWGELEDQYLALLCQRELECCLPSDRASALHDQSTDAAECHATYKVDWQSSAKQFDARLRGGGIVFDPARARACIAELEALDCSLANGSSAVFFAHCARAIVGKSARGAACKESVDCGEHDWCDSSMTCVPRPTVGQSCANGLCAAELFCDVTVGGVCTERRPFGGKCATDYECQSYRCDVLGDALGLRNAPIKNRPPRDAQRPVGTALRLSEDEVSVSRLCRSFE